MLLVSPVTWDFSLPLLLVPIAVIARRAAKSGWMAITLMLILVVVWIPQNMLTELAQSGRSFTVFPWTFMLGAPSLKFYALLGTLVLGLAAFKVESGTEEDVPKRSRESAMGDQTNPRQVCPATLLEIFDPRASHFTIMRHIT
jgi:hypothetical protein